VAANAGVGYGLYLLGTNGHWVGFGFAAFFDMLFLLGAAGAGIADIWNDDYDVYESWDKENPNYYYLRGGIKW